MAMDARHQWAEVGLPTPFDAWSLSRILSGREPRPEQVEAMSAEYRPIALAMLQVGGTDERRGLFSEFRSRQPDPEGLRQCLLDHGLVSPPGEGRVVRVEVPVRADPLDPDMPADADDLSRTAEGVRWFWKGWIPRGRISGLAGFEGTGKTRFGLDIARRAFHGLPAPDGQPLEVAAGLKSLWICADGHHDELAETAKAMGIPAGALLFNAPKGEPYGGVDLDSEESLAQLERFLKRSRAPLAFVDTLTNATRRDLCRQSDVKSLLTPLLEIAQRQDIAIILMLHLSRDGQALGRRVKGLTRTLIHLECPDPDSQPGRLRLWVEKSFTLKPPPLGVLMSDVGNHYDTNPPGKSDRTQNGRPGDKIAKAAEFLLEALADGDRKGCDLVSDWEALGGSKGTLFNARESLSRAGRLAVDDTRKPQIWHLVRMKA